MADGISKFQKTRYKAALLKAVTANPIYRVAGRQIVVNTPLPRLLESVEFRANANHSRFYREPSPPRREPSPPPSPPREPSQPPSPPRSPAGQNPGNAA